MFIPSNFAHAVVSNTVHNLSTSGPGTVKSDTEDKICLFCHTPHNSNPVKPISNHTLSGQTYTTYSSSSIDATDIGQPDGTSKLCLSCHDGQTINSGNPITDIETHVYKITSHDVQNYSAIHYPTEGTPPSDTSTNKHVECSDCHRLS